MTDEVHPAQKACGLVVLHQPQQGCARGARQNHPVPGAARRDALELLDGWSGQSRRRTEHLQQISMSKRRIALLKELMRTRNRAMRELLGAGNRQAVSCYVTPAPDLDVIGIAEPARPDILADLWAAVLWTTRVLRSTTQKNLV